MLRRCCVDNGNEFPTIAAPVVAPMPSFRPELSKVLNWPARKLATIWWLATVREHRK
jgi:hypothetical protein